MWAILDPRFTLDMLGLIPEQITAEDDRPLKEQINENYAHGGGWRPGGMNRCVFHASDGSFTYPGDPRQKALAMFVHPTNGETFYYYDYSIVCVVTGDGVAEFSRMD